MSDHGRPPSARRDWLSQRSLVLHLALLVWFPGCLVAFWWQVHRALGGNALSYLYSIEWPAFAIAGVWVWWQLVHTEPAGLGPAPLGQEIGTASASGAVEGAGSPEPHPVRRREEEDPELAAYNDRLARLASEGPKGWRRR